MADEVPDKEHAQKFGGPWSLLKIAAVENYLNAFVKVMKNQSFQLVYIDAFAGSGSFTFGGELPQLDPSERALIFAGSVKRALAVPQFSELYFFENDQRNLASLRAVAGQDARARIIAGDANVELVTLIRSLDWHNRRGVIFVDPCGPETNWEMLRAIANTKALDMFWLFPLSAVYRNAPRNHEQLVPEKRAMVSKCLGTDDWEDHFYRPNTAAIGDLFLDAPARKVRHVEIETIEAYVVEKLAAVFPHVERPARLRGPTNAPLFNLFFAVSNPSEAAIKRASPIARHLLRAI
jgi:three-Cys-motif partner protein